MAAATTTSFILSVLECLEEISRLLGEAVHTTDAAIACAKADAEHEAVRIVMDLEQNTFEADKLLSAVTFLARLHRKRSAF